MAPPLSSENLTVIVVVFVVAMVVVLASVFALIFVGRQTIVTTPNPPAPRVIGINVGHSGDQSNWILTFTSVPTGLSPVNTMLTLLTPGGATSLPDTPLAYLNGSANVSYVPVQPGSPVSVGDRLLISTSTYPTGYGYRISDATRTFVSGTLQ